MVMARFVVRHTPSPEQRPGQDPYRGARLLNHLNRPMVARLELNIPGEAVVKGEHTNI
jgi:hypothetical protein